MPGTYTPIASYTFPSDAASYTFNTIPSTYDDLVIVGANMTATTTFTVYWQANGDTGSNYAHAYLVAPNGYGVQTLSGKGLTLTHAMIGSISAGVNASIAGGFNMTINQYSQSSYPKVCISAWNEADLEASIFTSMWTGTTAINSLTLKLSSGSASFKTGTRISLYGIKKA